MSSYTAAAHAAVTTASPRSYADLTKAGTAGDKGKQSNDNNTKDKRTPNIAARSAKSDNKSTGQGFFEEDCEFVEFVEDMEESVLLTKCA